MSTYKGACLCGQITYNVTDPQAMGVCHCTRCQRWVGSGMTGVVANKENVEFTSGTDVIKRFESEFAPRNFCGNCGSSIYDDLGEQYFVLAGLMPDLDLKPSFHLQVAYKADWETICDDATQYPEGM